MDRIARARAPGDALTRLRKSIEQGGGLGESCAGGQCVAVGSYTTNTGAIQATAAVERHGRWKRPVEVTRVTCDNAGACTVAGAFRTRAGDMKLMIAARS